MGGDELSIQRPDDIDYLSLYRGKPCIINDDIRINVPTLDEICDYNDTKYFGMVHTLCSVGVELCWQLNEIGIDFEEVSDYRLFYSMLAKNYNNEQTRILFGDHLDFSKMKLYMNKDDESISMVQQYLVSVPFMSEYGEEMTQIPYGDKVILIEQGENVSKIKYNDNIGYVMSIYLSENENGKCHIADEYNPKYFGNGTYHNIIIDENIYYQIVKYLRAIHNLKRDNRVAGTPGCKRAFIEDAKMEYEAMLLEPKKSTLLPLVSTMVNSEGFKRNDKDVWDMNIYAFMDSVKRIAKIKNASLLLQSGYSGFGIDLKKIKKDELDYMGELN